MPRGELCHGFRADRTLRPLQQQLQHRMAPLVASKQRPHMPHSRRRQRAVVVAAAARQHVQHRDGARRGRPQEGSGLLVLLLLLGIQPIQLLDISAQWHHIPLKFLEEHAATLNIFDGFVKPGWLQNLLDVLQVNLPGILLPRRRSAAATAAAASAEEHPLRLLAAEPRQQRAELRAAQAGERTWCGRQRGAIGTIIVGLVLALLDFDAHRALRRGLLARRWRGICSLQALDLVCLPEGGLGLLEQVTGLLVLREELDCVLEVFHSLSPAVKSTKRCGTAHEGLEARVRAPLEAVFEYLRVLYDLVTRSDCVVPTEDLQLREGLVGPQRLVVSLVLQALLVVLDSAHKVAIFHALVAALPALLRGLGLLGGLLVSVLDVRLHREELGVVPGHDRVALVLRVRVGLPVLPRLVVDVAASPQQRL
mmetsp:Transcript_145039/g.368024  ORF Transcript_145039/g.368024 Transcript_145039/m.368024 type:complete len:423 (-) Transcript_145039:610-1878(-)